MTSEPVATCAAPPGSTDTMASPRVVDFFKEQEKNATDSRPILAIRTLLLVLEESTATTMMGLQAELEEATEALLLYADSEDSEPSRSTALSLRSGCELFVRHVTRSFVDFPGDFQACKDMVLRRGGQFAELSERSRLSIARLGHPFVRDGSVLLTHGHSRVVMQVLLEAARVGKQFSVVVTECSPDRVGVVEQARGLMDAGIPVTFVTDAGVAAVMERVDMAIVGAEVRLSGFATVEASPGPAPPGPARPRPTSTQDVIHMSSRESQSHASKPTTTWRAHYTHRRLSNRVAW